MSHYNGFAEKRGKQGHVFFLREGEELEFFFFIFSVGIRAVLRFKFVRGLKMSSWR